jgi:hypothetical protein
VGIGRPLDDTWVLRLIISSPSHRLAHTRRECQPGKPTVRLCFADRRQVPRDDVAVQHMIGSLWATPANVELHGHGSDKAVLLAEPTAQISGRAGSVHQQA